MCYNYVSQVCTHRTPTPMIHSTNIGNNSEPDNNKGSKNFSCNEDFFIPCGVGSQGKNPDFVGRAAAKSGAQVLRGETYISGNGLCTRVFYGKFLQTAAGQRCSFQNAGKSATTQQRQVSELLQTFAGEDETMAVPTHTTGIKDTRHQAVTACLH